MKYSIPTKRAITINMYNCFRAGHIYAQVAPYAKEVAKITTPLFCQYGTFNTGKTTLLTAISSMHGITGGKVQREYNIAKHNYN